MFQCSKKNSWQNRRYILYSTHVDEILMINNIGVRDVSADVDKKLVTALCAEEVDPNVLLSALQKWGSASGKSVELLTE